MMMPEANASAADVRLALLHEWLSPRFGAVELTPASSDASFRRYFRFHYGDGSYVVMDAPPPQEDCRPFVDIAARLAVAGIHVPAILAQDIERGFLLLSDLGDAVYLTALTEHNADGLFADAIATLVRMQARTDTAGLPEYDQALLLRELQLFSNWYLERHLGVALSAAERRELTAVYDRLIERALAQPRVFVHRDYMPRNLMISAPNPGVLDFQDAVSGPISYDPICLFKDAFISWPEERVSGWLESYRRQAAASDLPVPATLGEFQAELDWMGLQRHLKVLGIFARICHRDGKPKYLEDAPRFIRYIMQVAPHYRELAPLADLFERHILPTEA